MNYLILNLTNNNNMIIHPLRNIKTKTKPKIEFNSGMKNIIYNNESELFLEFDYINKLLKYNKFKKINYF